MGLRFSANLLEKVKKTFENCFYRQEKIRRNTGKRAHCTLLFSMKLMQFAGKEDLIILGQVQIQFILDAKDAVVNQLLTNLDGVEALDNIIVIGMTNRKDLIDEAVLRPGRLEVHIEIGIPSEEGRLQILKIHTQTLKDQNLLNKDVNLEELAQIAKNYTGAEL